MSHIVLKIGGTALSNGAAFASAEALVRATENYTIIVPSAPAGYDWRMTELLRRLQRVEERSLIYYQIEEVLQEIARSRSLGMDVERWISEQIMQLSQFADMQDADWSFIISRGEFWSGTLLARSLDLPLVDPTSLIKFRLNGEYDERATKRAFKEASLPERFVMPGFYGSDPEGRVHLFPRNGSDISAAIVAAETGASELHIARKRAPGIYSVNPGIYEGSPNDLRVISYMSHEQAREMTYRSDSGALHPLALVPVARAGVSVRVFDIDKPGKRGTYIVPTGHPALPRHRKVIGIAERAGFTVFTLKRTGLNERRNFMDRVGLALKSHGIGYEHEVTGVDRVSLILSNDTLKSRHKEVAQTLRRVCKVSVTWRSSEGTICLVGNDLGSNLVDLGYLLIALGTHCGNQSEPPGSEVRLSFLSMSDEGTSIVLGVQSDALRKAVNRIYHQLVRGR